MTRLIDADALLKEGNENVRIYTTTTKIPFPHEILKGDWHGSVYAIDTCGGTLEDHIRIVDEQVSAIQKEFDKNNHYSVSLREVKRELACNFERTNSYMTLVQFRVRDSY